MRYYGFGLKASHPAMPRRVTVFLRACLLSTPPPKKRQSVGLTRRTTNGNSADCHKIEGVLTAQKIRAPSEKGNEHAASIIIAHQDLYWSGPITVFLVSSLF